MEVNLLKTNQTWDGLTLSVQCGKDDGWEYVEDASPWLIAWDDVLGGPGISVSDWRIDDDGEWDEQVVAVSLRELVVNSYWFIALEEGEAADAISAEKCAAAFEAMAADIRAVVARLRR